MAREQPKGSSSTSIYIYTLYIIQGVPKINFPLDSFTKSKKKFDSRWSLVALTRPIDSGHYCNPFFSSREEKKIYFYWIGLWCTGPITTHDQYGLDALCIGPRKGSHAATVHCYGERSTARRFQGSCKTLSDQKHFKNISRTVEEHFSL